MNGSRCADPRRDPQQWLLDVLAGAQRIPCRGLSVPEIKTLTGLAGKVKAAMDALLVGFASEVAASGTAASPQKVLQQATRMSKRDANRMARTAESIEAMPNVKERFAAGEISLEHAAVLANTAKEAGPEAVDNNTELLVRAAETTPDVLAGEAKRFAARVSDDRGEKLLARQRRRRKASLWKDPDTGMGRLSAELDPVGFGLVEQALHTHAQALRRGDQSGAAGSGVGRSGPQRLADALVERLSGLDALTHAPLGAGSPAPSCKDTMTGSSDGPGCHEHGKHSRAGHKDGHAGSADSSIATGRNTNTEARSGPATRGAKPPQLVVVADIGVIDGTNPAGRCEIPGTGPVPPSILEQLSPDTKLAGIIFAGDGQPLWLGRSRRNPSAHQRLAVAIRDRGCVQCGEPMHNCHIHHKIPWENGGPTDIDNLEALCAQHHRQHHRPHKPDQRRGKQPPGPGRRPANRHNTANSPPAAQTAQAGPARPHERRTGRSQRRPSRASTADDDPEPQQLPLQH